MRREPSLAVAAGGFEVVKTPHHGSAQPRRRPHGGRPGTGGRGERREDNDYGTRQRATWRCCAATGTPCSAPTSTATWRWSSGTVRSAWRRAADGPRRGWSVPVRDTLLGGVRRGPRSSGVFAAGWAWRPDLALCVPTVAEHDAGTGVSGDARTAASRRREGREAGGRGRSVRTHPAKGSRARPTHPPSLEGPHRADPPVRRRLCTPGDGWSPRRS